MKNGSINILDIEVIYVNSHVYPLPTHAYK
jgi:hypothetical protein